MQYRLTGIRERKIDGFAYLIKEVETDTLIAWALVKEFEYLPEPEVYFYVRNTHRRQGYGTRLIKAINKDFGKVRVFPHDTVSDVFFNSFPERVIQP